MPKNEDGEFEVVLGNRQLLSVFFIVVILFGVFFTMGYIVGRNSAPAVAAIPAATRTEVAEARQPAAPAAAPAPVSQPPVAATRPAAEATAPVTRTQPVQETPPAAEKPKPQPEPPKREPPPPKVAADPEPGPGRLYLQVAAVGRPEAEVEVNTLKKRGFPAHVGPGPREGIFRVLVGPYKTSADAARIKGELEALGFKPYVRK